MAWATLRLSLLLAALILAQPLAQAQDPVAGGQAGVLALSFRDPLLFLLVSSSECGLAVAFRPEGGGWVLALIDPLAGEPRWYLEVPGSVSDLLALDQRIYVALGGEPGILSLDCEAESVYMLRVDPGIPGYANARLAWAGDRLVVAYFSHNYTRIVLLLLDPERVELLASHSLRLQIPGGVGGVSDVWLASGGGLIAVAANYNVYAYEGRITGGVSVIGVNGSSLSLLASYFVEDFKIMGSGIVEGTVYVAGYFRENRGSIGDSAILWVGESGRGGLIV
nr:hypothetical protein [Desulfurococcales archaeon]